ncbi:TetR/AcrR family transcriptional regulator [Streptomyces lacrimifluminis]|uniref:TetR family transcriptional regulator n=1 Tax=Streptomyces lacrimifluminis TaxID=1500077 RepID=A0A917L498_9ACTN|nr:TetR/AcrR family transcriptional regulator [Streptomyces lacrimifluminis]GGJ43719.1 TetR family transcriptional regulator [Streptomyces lacrimifluminis]
MAAQGRPQRAGAGGRSKRESILDAAVELFLELGFDQTSMDAVAAQAGVSKTTVYAHFGDKLELFRAVIACGGASLDFDLDQTMLASVDDPQERLARIVLKLLQATTAPYYLAFIRVLTVEAARRPELTETLRSLGVPHVVGLVAAALREDARQRGGVLPDAEVHAGLFVRMTVAGPQMDALLDLEADRDPVHFEAYARWVTAIFLRGLRSDDLPDAPDSAISQVFPWLSRANS